MTAGIEFDDLPVDASPTLATTLLAETAGVKGQLAVSELAELLADPASALALAVGSGQLANPTELAANGLLPEDSTAIVLRGVIYVALPVQTAQTARFLQVTDGVGLVPYGYPSSADSINGDLNPIVALQPGLHLLTGDGASDWNVFAAFPSPRNDYTGTSSAPSSGTDETSGWSKGSWILDSSGDLWFCRDASTGAADWQQVQFV